MEHLTADFLIIGSGIAGLTYALKVAEHGKVIILTKGKAEESNTKYAQGGIAAVTAIDDSIESHVQDTLQCGAGLCDETVVRMVVTEGIARVKEIIKWGASFDKQPSGQYDLAKEGGHSAHRVLHFKDSTGNEIERTLLKQVNEHANISFYTHYFAIDLITQHHLGQEVKRGMDGIACFGAYALNVKTGHIATVMAHTTLLATGGAGQVYANTTNPVIATGDGVAMAYRAKANVKDMEFIQFHPTALYNPGEHPSFLITEAVRGHGAVLRNANGHSFMEHYDPRASLAPRDIVARAIDNEMKKHGHEMVYLDCTHFVKGDFEKHFPMILEKCKTLNINPEKDFIPVVPAAHYMCGGVVVDVHGCSNITHLYAAGECAATGLHGGNRLASNSLLEALVYAHRAALHAVNTSKVPKPLPMIPNWNDEGTKQPNEMVLITANRKELQSIMSNYVAIVRSDIRLKRALDRLRIIYGETEALYLRTKLSPAICELRNMITVAYLIVKAAMQRKQSIGLHYTTDYLPSATAAHD